MKKTIAETHTIEVCDYCEEPLPNWGKHIARDRVYCSTYCYDKGEEKIHISRIHQLPNDSDKHGGRSIAVMVGCLTFMALCGWLAKSLFEWVRSWR